MPALCLLARHSHSVPIDTWWLYTVMGKKRKYVFVYQGLNNKCLPHQLCCHLRWQQQQQKEFLGRITWEIFWPTQSHSSPKIFRQHLNWVEVWTFSIFFLTSPLSCQFASAWEHCPVAWANFRQAFAAGQMASLLLKNILVYSGVHCCLHENILGPAAAKQGQIISPPPLGLTVGMRCLWSYAVFDFSQTGHCA